MYGLVAVGLVSSEHRPIAPSTQPLVCDQYRSAAIIITAGRPHSQLNALEEAAAGIRSKTTRTRTGTDQASSTAPQGCLRATPAVVICMRTTAARPGTARQWRWLLHGSMKRQRPQPSQLLLLLLLLLSRCYGRRLTVATVPLLQPSIAAASG